MRCTTCGQEFPKEQLQLIDGSRYCPGCKEKLFAPSKPKMSQRLVDAAAKKQKTNTKRIGRVDFILNSFLVWIVLPQFMNGYLPTYSPLRMFNRSLIDGEFNIEILPSWLWLVPAILSWLYASSRIQDTKLSSHLSWLLWLPGLNLALFIIKGESQKNQFGLPPGPPSTFKTTMAIPAALINVLVFAVVISLTLTTLLTL